jgi:hypothetical protein
MAEYKLKIKVGEHEFEAEGPADVVQAQFAAFKDLVSSMAVQKPAQDAPVAEVEKPPGKPDVPANNGGTLPLEKVMHTGGRIISLTVHTQSTADAILALLLGQRQFRGNDSVTGAEILDGLRQSGRTVERIDLILNRLSAEGSVITIGQHRARRYRLTNPGVNRAQEIVRGLIALVP